MSVVIQQVLTDIQEKLNKRGLKKRLMNLGVEH